MSSEWKEVHLQDLVTLKRGYDLPKADRLDGEFPILASNGITGFHNDFKVKGPGIVTGRSGTLGEVIFINRDFWPLNTTLYGKEFHGNNIRFVYYFLKTLHLENYNSGSSVPTLNRNHIHSLPVKIPCKHEQYKIGLTLSSLDDKIELNNAINKNLEEMAQTLFKRWFIDFEFPNDNGEPYKSSGGEFEESELGLIPKGWKVSNIGQYSKVRSGYAFKSSWWREKGIKVIKIKNITGNSINLDGVDYVDYEKTENASNFIARPGDILIAMTGATVGKIGLVPMLNECLLVNQRVGKFFLGGKPFKSNGYLFSLLTSKEIYDRIVSEASGSAQPNISPTDIENIKIKTPFNNSLIDKFNEITGSMLKTISGNIYEINQLSNLRDSLLPKLMSGEIRVPIDEQEQVSNI